MSRTRTPVPVVRLGDLLVDSCYGTNERSGASGSTPVVGITHIRDGRVRKTYMSRVSLPESQRQKLALRPGDILVTRTNSYDLVGLCGLVDSETDAVFASYLVRLRVDTDRIDPAYLNYWLNSPAGRRQVRRIATRAVGQANVNPTEFRRQVRVPLPPMPDQERIANILALWDTAIEMTGRLIRAKRVEIIGMSTAAMADADGCPTQLGDICTVSKGRGLSKDDLKPSGAHPCILYGELHTIYGEVVTEVRSRTDVFTPTRSLHGDVLIPSSSETSEDLANASALNEDDVLLGGDINVLRPRQSGKYDAEYLAYYLTHGKRREIARLAQGNSIVHLYGRDIARLEVTLPSIEHQVRIASALEFGRREIAVLERIRDRYLVQRRGVAQVLFGPAGVSIPGGPSEDVP